MKLYRYKQLIRPDLQAHIYSEDMLANVRSLRSLCPSHTKFCAVIKANAYGHGITEIANILKKAEVDFFAVASIYEALHIADMVSRPILVLEPINDSMPPDLIHLCVRKGLHCVISSTEAFHFISGILHSGKNPMNIHVNIETGMERCGIDTDQAGRLIAMIRQCPVARLAGVFTHFATADDQDLSFAWEQLERFNRFLAKNNLDGQRDFIIHAANSAATIKMPQAHFDMVRCGISMYGYYSRRMNQPPVRLVPVMKLQAPVSHLQKIPAGHSISYGRSFITTRDTLAAVIPLGYADGYRRCFSNTAKVKIGSCFAPVIGRVCMDQFIIDVTDVPDVTIGRPVTIIDNDHDSPCGVYALAETAQTICYEILTSVHSHVNRVIH